MSPIAQLLEVMAALRDPEGGCPWDLEQTPQTLVAHTLEEAYEVAEAMERGTPEEQRDELGDLLFQVVFYARLGEEGCRYDFDGIAAAAVAKLVRRHPHVFGSAEVADSVQQTAAWEEHKRTERRQRQQHGLLDGVGTALPALVRAQKLSRRAARAGFDWPDVQGVLAKVAEELEEVQEALDHGTAEPLEAEIGDLLFTCVNLARHAGMDAETALRRANARFEARVRAMEGQLKAAGSSVEGSSAQERDAAWERAKREVG